MYDIGFSSINSKNSLHTSLLLHYTKSEAGAGAKKRQFLMKPFEKRLKHSLFAYNFKNRLRAHYFFFFGKTEFLLCFERKFGKSICSLFKNISPQKILRTPLGANGIWRKSCVIKNKIEALRFFYSYCLKSFVRLDKKRTFITPV